MTVLRHPRVCVGSSARAFPLNRSCHSVSGINVTSSKAFFSSTRVNSTMMASTGANVLQGYDEEQVKLMEEMCIEVDKDDNAIGGISKKDGVYYYLFTWPLSVVFVNASA